MVQWQLDFAKNESLRFKFLIFQLLNSVGCDHLPQVLQFFRLFNLHLVRTPHFAVRRSVSDC